MSLRKKDLKIGEIYYMLPYPTQGGCEYIIKVEDFDTIVKGTYIEIKHFKQFTKSSNNVININTFLDVARLATEEEKQWLQACIDANKYIPKEEALKPIEMNKEQLLEKAKNDYPIGTVFNVAHLNKDVKHQDKVDNDNFIFELSDGSITLSGKSTNKHKWVRCICHRNKWAEIISKPEEIETTKVDTFVLPERWHVVVTKENQAILANWKGINDIEMLPIGYICGICGLLNEKGHNPANMIKSTYNSPFAYDFGVEITFDQFKKYVLKENVDIKPEVIDNSVYTLKQIEAALYKFDKEDIKDILDAIKKHK